MFAHGEFDHDPTGWAGGGFIGVDIFFVLSGYLITTLLLLEHNSVGSIAVTQFWWRRARRLLPALFVLLIGTALFAAVIARDYRLSEIRSQALATFFYVQNWIVIGSTSPESSPLSHTWSLAIEEQWYLVWPLAMLVILRLTGGRLRPLLGLIAVAAVGSAAAMFSLFDPHDHARAYYGTDARVQALLIGAALAVIYLRAPRDLPRRSMLVLETTGLLSVAFLVVVVGKANVEDAFLYRGGMLVIALASALLIAASIQEKSPVLGRVLSFTPLTAIGIISYGLYLYHWPIYLWLNPSRVGLSGYSLLVLRLVVTGVVATASYFIVEKPIRRGALSNRRLLILAPIAATAVLVLTIISTAAARGTTVNEIAAAGFKRLANNTPEGSDRVLVAGDGLAFSLGNAVGGPFSDLGIFGTTASVLGCGIADGQAMIDGYITRPVKCSARYSVYRNGVEHFDPKLSVLMLGGAEAFDRVVDGKTLLAGTPDASAYLRMQLDKARRVLTGNGAHFILTTVPCPVTTPTSPPGVLAVQQDRARYVWLTKVWRDYASEHPKDVTLLDLEPLLCVDGLPTAKDGIPLRTAAGLTPSGARLVWEQLANDVASSTKTEL